MDLHAFNELMWYLHVDEPRARALRELGECYWTLRADNTFGQPSAKQ